MKRRILVGCTALALALGGAAHAQPDAAKIKARVDKVLAKTPLIDGHNDVLLRLWRTDLVLGLGAVAPIHPGLLPSGEEG